ncbi:MAG: MarR family transcriptional regulator [Alphaproteobacteria bacterium]|nr:MarR family transcriptional regulator [Alphaproteobacteria bacterium]
MGAGHDRDADDIELGVLPGLVAYQLRRAQLGAFQDFGPRLVHEDLRPGWFGLLEIIANNEGSSQSRLAQALGIDGSTMVAMIDRMEANDWVRRARSPTDRRSHALFLTDNGRDVLEQATRRVREHDAAVTSELSPDERDELLRLLRKLTGV